MDNIYYETPGDADYDPVLDEKPLGQWGRREFDFPANCSIKIITNPASLNYLDEFCNWIWKKGHIHLVLWTGRADQRIDYNACIKAGFKEVLRFPSCHGNYPVVVLAWTK